MCCAVSTVRVKELLTPARRRALRWILTAVVVGVVGFLFTRALIDNWDAVADTDLSPDGWLVGAVLLFAGAVVISGVLWGAMISQLGKVKVSIAEAVRVHNLSWLLKYIPGQVGSVVNKLAWAQSRGVPKTLTSLSFLYENAFLLIGSIVPTGVILVVLGSFDVSEGWTVILTVASVVPLVLLTSRPILRWATNIVARRALKREVPQEYFLTSGQALKYQFWYLIPRAVNGAGVVLIAISLFEVPASSYLPLACAYIFAGAAGILAVFVPSGIGVRESVMVLLSVAYLPVEQAIVLALAARLLATMGDGVVAIIYGALKLTDRRERVRA